MKVKKDSLPAKSKPTPGEPSQVLQVLIDPARPEHQQIAEQCMSPVMLGSTTAKVWAERATGQLGTNEVLAVVQRRATDAAAGNLDAAKELLMAQAITLDAIFNDMARRASTLIRVKADGAWSISGDSMETLTRVAFKAQGQCRATLQTLGELVNPRSVAFIKQAPGSQANVAQGAQQVNNGVPAHPQESENPSNKLLEDNPSERLDIGAQAAPGGANQVLEAVGAVNGAEDAGGKVRRLSERAQARAA